MPIEQRVIGGGQKIGGGKIGGSPAKEEPAAEEPKKKSKKLLIIIAALVIVVGGAAAYFFLLKPGGSGEPAAEPEPEPGEVLTVEPISLNLADGHYLRLGFAMQMTADAAAGEGEGEGGIDTSKAIDTAIELYSGRTVAEVSGTDSRVALKDQFLAQLNDGYHDTVLEVNFTNYVTQ
ncbi:flagellar basal body-associated FliL family protein [Cellulomonas taurus]|uniref:flagellar basal body-associated FliL family protein n=1 Tax=Cellulomonas taurus TaxID=2729175 RepID=UPI00145CBDC5|nr:flagellar basal body-associated FliL family protein [Cellulomonas taurus]